MGEREAIHNIFMMTSKSVKRFGLWDENIFPALCEGELAAAGLLIDRQCQQHVPGTSVHHHHQGWRRLRRGCRVHALLNIGQPRRQLVRSFVYYGCRPPSWGSHQYPTLHRCSRQCMCGGPGFAAERWLMLLSAQILTCFIV